MGGKRKGGRKEREKGEEEARERAKEEEGGGGEGRGVPKGEVGPGTRSFPVGALRAYEGDLARGPPGGAPPGGTEQPSITSATSLPPPLPPLSLRRPSSLFLFASPAYLSLPLPFSRLLLLLPHLSLHPPLLPFSLSFSPPFSSPFFLLLPLPPSPRER